MNPGLAFLLNLFLDRRVHDKESVTLAVVVPGGGPTGGGGHLV
jgi:hypothetical protein